MALSGLWSSKDLRDRLTSPLVSFVALSPQRILTVDGVLCHSPSIPAVQVCSLANFPHLLQLRPLSVSGHFLVTEHKLTSSKNHRPHAQQRFAIRCF